MKEKVKNMTPGVFKNRYMRTNIKTFAKYKKEPFEVFETLEDTYEMPEVLDFEIREAVEKVLSTLTPREERVLRMRFGIGMDTDHTLVEVGHQFSVSMERIRQIENKALRKLRHPDRSRTLRNVA